MSSIDFFATEPHYLDHLAPVWHALPVWARGECVVPDRLKDRAEARGLDVRVGTSGHAPYGIVASYRDMVLLAPREQGLVFMEHGSGQSYGHPGYPPEIRFHPAYAGGTDRERVDLFLCPNEHSTARNRAAYPDARVETIGSPWLETLTCREPVDHPLTIAVAFHSNVEVCGETMSAWPWWKDSLLDALFDTRWRIIGHGHPRALTELQGWYDVHGGGEIIVVPEFEQVVDEADTLVCDNSSIQYVWAALHRPQVVLNAPWYGKDARHGLRFWDAVPGPQADTVEDLPDALRRSDDQSLRARAVEKAWGDVDGKAADRAATAILDLIQ